MGESNDDRGSDAGPHLNKAMRRRLGCSAQFGSLATPGTDWCSLPGWTIPTAAAVWVVKDVLLYPALKTAYEGAQPIGQESMVGLVVAPAWAASDRRAPEGRLQGAGRGRCAASGHAKGLQGTNQTP